MPGREALTLANPRLPRAQECVQRLSGRPLAGFCARDRYPKGQDPQGLGDGPWAVVEPGPEGTRPGLALSPEAAHYPFT